MKLCTEPKAAHWFHCVCTRCAESGCVFGMRANTNHKPSWLGGKMAPGITTGITMSREAETRSDRLVLFPLCQHMEDFWSFSRASGEVVCLCVRYVSDFAVKLISLPLCVCVKNIAVQYYWRFMLWLQTPFIVAKSSRLVGLHLTRVSVRVQNLVFGVSANGR